MDALVRSSCTLVDYAREIPSPCLCSLFRWTFSRMVIKAQEMHVLSKILGCCPMQRLSLYADDVVLFIIRPLGSDLLFVKEALKFFGVASGLHVNFAKSSAILIRSEEGDEELVQNALPWKIERFPCKYLGLQLGIKQHTRSEWQLVVDSVLKLVPGWQRGIITRP